MNVLEGLYAARAGIDPQSFDFFDYTACTCGHIYRGANGERASTDSAVTAHPEGLYEAMLRAVVEANELVPGHFYRADDLAGAVSYATSVMFHRRRATDRREAAVLLLSTAIEKLEAEQQRAMLGVKARGEGAVSGELAGLVGAGR